MLWGFSVRVAAAAAVCTFLFVLVSNSRTHDAVAAIRVRYKALAQHDGSVRAGNNSAYHADSAAVSPYDLLVSKLNRIEHELSTYNARYYMYPEDDIANLGSKHGARVGYFKKHLANLYARDSLAEVEILDILENHTLRVTEDPELAQLYIVPMSVGAIWTTYGVRAGIQYNRSFDALTAHPIFKAAQGHNHVLISLTVPLFSTEHIGLVPLQGRHYKKLWNVTVATVYDVEGSRDLLSTASANQSKAGDYDHIFAFGANPVVRSTFSLSLMPTKSVPFHEASYEKFMNSSNFVFYRSRNSTSINNATQYRWAPFNETVISGLPKSSIGNDLEKEEWRKQFLDSKFCLCIRGDSPHTHALIRAVKVGCIPVIVADCYALYSPILKSSVDMYDHVIFLDEARFLEDPLRELQSLQRISDVDIRMKLKALAFAQRVVIPDHPDSLFVPAFLKEASVSSTREHPSTY